jgi:hypothetical protein
MGCLTNASGVYLVACLGESNGCDGEFRLDMICCELLSRIPHANVTIVPSTHEHLQATAADIQSIYNFFVANMASDTLACLDVPAGECSIGGCTEDNV